MLASCGPNRQEGNELLSKVEINPLHEMIPPIAQNIFIEELEKPLDDGSNLRLVAEFEKGIMEDVFLAVLIEGEKFVLRDDGQGADIEKGDNKFSVYIIDDFEEVKRELNERQKLAIDAQQNFDFVNRSMRPNNSLEEIRGFKFENVRKGVMTRVPIDLVKGIKRLSDQRKTLMVTNVGVVEDPSRTFNPCTNVGNPNGVWTFGQLMKQMASSNPAAVTDLQVSNFIRNWITNWRVDQLVNGETLLARTGINQIIENWNIKSGLAPADNVGVLKLEFAPFKLLAIVNRLDLRGNSGYGFSNAGEGRFVFEALNNLCNPMEFTVIFEYGINKSSCLAVRAFAEEWNNLNAMVLGSPTYNDALENITNQFTQAGTNSDKPNGNSINQIRTNERAIGAPWELREFNLLVNGQLGLVDVKQEPAVKYNGFNAQAVSPIADVEKLATWVNDHAPAIEDNNYEVPIFLPDSITPFRGGHSLFPADNSSQIWNGRGASGSQFINSDEARHVFSLNACSSCHGGETNTQFLHVRTASFGSEATLSGFLTGVTLADPAGRPIGSPTSRTFNDLLRRNLDLSGLISSTCLKKRPFFEIAHKLTFNPVRMTH